MEFVGRGYLLECSSYETKKDKTDPKSPMVTKYKYAFLVGDLDKGYLFNAHLETFVSDTPLFKKEHKLMDQIDIKLEVRSFQRKVGDQFITEVKPVYSVIAEV